MINMKKSLAIFLLVVLAAFVVAGGYGLYYFNFADNNQASGKLSEAQARVIAEKSCLQGGESLALGYYNENSKTWWFAANLNSVRTGCNPACVVSEETRQAEINWRCTGLIVPSATTPSSGNDIEVKVYYMNNNLDKEITCNKVFPVIRQIAQTQAVASATLAELLKGPTEAEKANGYSTTINPGTQIQKLSIIDGLARIDFDNTLEKNVAGSCRVTAIRSEITETLKQFTSVKDVVISVDGRTEDVLQP